MVLYICHYHVTSIERQSEILFALKKNTQNNIFTTIHVFVEEGTYYGTANPSPTDCPPPSPIEIHPRNIPKMRWHLGEQPTIATYIDHANKNHPNEIIVIANSDIYFDDSLSLLENYNFTNRFLALTRWNTDVGGSITMWPRGDSQDAWIFKAPLKRFNADFYQGTIAIDNRLAFEADAAGLDVLNPCFSIKAIHHHPSEIRNYKREPYTGGMKTLDHCDIYDIISYSLFTPKSLHSRTYDPFEKDMNRYWFNVPSLVAVNKIVYPMFKTRIHTNEQIKNHFLYPLLHEMAERKLIELIFCDNSFTFTQPTVWRLKPLFEKNSKTTICRDIDSIPNAKEIQATLAFLGSDFLVQAMRTHSHHNGASCRLLAGLCGFKGGMKNYIDGTFDELYAKAGGHWGCDQDLLIHYFIDRLGPEFVKNNFLDTAISTIWSMCDIHDAGKLPQEAYDTVDLSYIPNEVLEMTNAITTWPGQPASMQWEPTKKLLSMDIPTCKEINDIVNGIPAAKEFYFGAL